MLFQDRLPKRFITPSFRKDIEEMEKEKDIVSKRIERMQRKVEGMHNMETMLEVTILFP